MSLIQAFITGAQFALSAHQLAQDAKAKKEEAEGHWVTIGAEAGPDGAKHGGRPVFIEGGEPKGKKAESKKAESDAPSVPYASGPQIPQFEEMTGDEDLPF